MTGADRELAGAMPVYGRRVEGVASYLRKRGLIPWGGAAGAPPACGMRAGRAPARSAAALQEL